MSLHVGKRYVVADDLFVERRTIGLRRLVTSGNGSTALIRKGSSVLLVATDPAFVLEWNGEELALDAEIAERFSVDMAD